MEERWNSALYSAVAVLKKNFNYFASFYIVCVLVLMLLVIFLTAEGSKAVAGTGRAAMGKSTKQSSQKKTGPSSPVAADKNPGDRPLDKDRKKDAPHPRKQVDDETRMEKARRRAVGNPTESRTRVELFQHLPQYEHRTKLSNLESKFFHLGLVHPSVFEVLFWN